MQSDTDRNTENTKSIFEMPVNDVEIDRNIDPVTQPPVPACFLKDPQKYAVVIEFPEFWLSNQSEWIYD